MLGLGLFWHRLTRNITNPRNRFGVRITYFSISLYTRSKDAIRGSVWPGRQEGSNSAEKNLRQRWDPAVAQTADFA